MGYSLEPCLCQSLVFPNLLSVYYLNSEIHEAIEVIWHGLRPMPNSYSLLWMQPTEKQHRHSALVLRLILAEKKDDEKDESRHLMGLLTLVSLALNNIETPECTPSIDLIPFIEWIRWDKRFPDPIHCVACIMFGMAKNEVSCKGHSNQIRRLRKQY